MSDEVPSMAILLFNAAQDGNVDELRSLLLEATKEDVNFQHTENYETALIVASEKNHSDIVRMLLACQGIKVNVPNKYGWTALIKACYWGSLDTLPLLLAHPEIDVNWQIKETGFSALILSSSSGRNKAIKLLLDHPNIDTTLQDNEGKTALEKAENKAIKRMIQAHIAAHDGTERKSKCTVS